MYAEKCLLQYLDMVKKLITGKIKKKKELESNVLNNLMIVCFMNAKLDYSLKTNSKTRHTI